MSKKYTFCNESESKTIYLDEEGKKDPVTVRRIKALVDIPLNEVKAGDFGGYIQSETNLSHEGRAWVYKDAAVCHQARVTDNAKIAGEARVYGFAKVSGNAEVLGRAHVFERAEVSDEACVFDNAKVGDQAVVDVWATIGGDAQILGHTHVTEEASILNGILRSEKGDAPLTDIDFPCAAHLEDEDHPRYVPSFAMSPRA